MRASSQDAFTIDRRSSDRHAEAHLSTTCRECSPPSVTGFVDRKCVGKGGQAEYQPNSERGHVSTVGNACDTETAGVRGRGCGSVPKTLQRRIAVVMQALRMPRVKLLTCTFSDTHGQALTTTIGFQGHVPCQQGCGSLELHYFMPVPFPGVVATPTAARSEIQ